MLATTELEVFPICLGGNVFGWTADEQVSFDVLDAYTAAGGNSSNLKYRVLINSSFQQGKAPCRSFPEETFERAVLSCLREINPADIIGRDETDDEIRGLETSLHLAQCQRQTLEDELLKGDIASLARALRKVAVGK